jgi:hypothetical protein
LAYLGTFNPYSLFPFLKGTETDLAAAVLGYKGVVMDSIVEDRLLAEASQGSEDQKLVEQLNLDKIQLGQLLLQPAQKSMTHFGRRLAKRCKVRQKGSSSARMDKLNFISFATLLSKDKRFLAQKYDVQYVASGRDLLR